MPYGLLGLLSMAVGEALIVLARRPVSDYYFPFVWIGFALLLDAGYRAWRGESLLSNRPGKFAALYLLSIGFWWTFELFNVAVHNWRYVGAGTYQGFKFVLFASLDFSTVLAAVWSAAACIRALLPPHRRGRTGELRGWVYPASIAIGLVSIVLPVLWPQYCFGLIWICLFFLLDPINDLLGRPSILRAVAGGEWQLPVSFALGTLLCGICWEAWNFWAMPKWVYTIPHVGFAHVFEMPALGYSGYLPFGLELFAMTNFVLPFLGLGTLTLDHGDSDSAIEGRLAS